MNSSASRGLSPVTFFLLTFALSIPFLLLSAATGIEVLPGIPISGLAFVCPASAALILVYRANRAAGVGDLFRRSFDYKRIVSKIWYVPVLLIMPAKDVLSFVVLRVMGVTLPAPQVPGLTALILFVAFFIGALGEELGWSGYAIDPMQDRLGALRAAVVLGMVWAGWHIVPLMQAHRSFNWIAWWCLGTVAMRVVMVWLYNNTGKSVFAMALFHASSNLSWQLFPVHGSYFDPRVGGLITTFFAAIAAVAMRPGNVSWSLRATHKSEVARQP
jgi:membrane protease YdiL (CAAX protease family)